MHKTIVLVTHDIDEAIKLGDRVAILNIGGKLEQYDHPAEVLQDPANEFVADFLGEDRGIKRLTLIPIRTVDLDRGPVVTPDTDMAQAKAVMARYEIDWVAVGEGDRIDGWISAADLDGSGIVDAPIRPFRTTLTPDSTLKDALDAVVSSHTRVAAVFDGDRLGRFIIDGFARGDEVMVFAGGLLVALLAVLTEVFFSIIERVILPRGLQISRANAEAAAIAPS